jgi:hypothetical protein
MMAEHIRFASALQNPRRHCVNAVTQATALKQGAGPGRTDPAPLAQTL